MKSSGSVAGRSDNSSRLRRNRKPPTCAPCRLKRLRCDRTLPSCTNCLTRPEIEHCEYSSRWRKSNLHRHAAPTPAPDEHDEEDEDDDVSEDEGGAERTMREKLERLERMIASLMESKHCRTGAGSCAAKKQQRREQQEQAAKEGEASSENKCSGEAPWSTMLNEKIHRWQQGLSRHQPTAAGSASTEAGEKT